MNNFKKVIALLLMAIMALSIAPIGVLAEDAPSSDAPSEDVPVDEAPEVYWDKDIFNVNENAMEVADSDPTNPEATAIEAKILNAENGNVTGGDASATLTFETGVKIAPVDVGSEEDKEAHGNGFMLYPMHKDDAFTPKFTLDFENADYSGIVQISFDILFGDLTEGLNMVFTSDDGSSTDIAWNGDWVFMTPKGGTANKVSSGMTDATTLNVWKKYIITLDTNEKNKTMIINRDGTDVTDSGRNGTNLFTGISGNLTKIEIYRGAFTAYTDATTGADKADKYVWIDNLSVRSYTEKPEFVGASYDEEGNLKPTTDIPATKVLNVELDNPVLTPALEGDTKEFVVDNEKSTFALTKVDPVTFEAVDGGSVEISKAITVGDENRAWQLYLDNKLDDGNTYKLTMANITDSTDREPISVEYLFTTKAKPENHGVYKLGYLVDGDNNLTGDEIGPNASVTADLEVINYSDEAVDVTGAIVIYKKVGDKLQMCGIKAATEHLESGATSETLDSALNITTPADDAVYVAKTFAWKDLTNFIPFASDSYR